MKDQSYLFSRTHPFHHLAHCAVLLMAMLFTACGALDPYESRFANVSVGDTRAQLTATMRDAPDQRNQLNLPLITVEQLTWRAPPGRAYLVHLAFDRVVAKSIVQ